MAIQSEAALEEALIKQLQSMEYSRVEILDESAMLANLRRQLEVHNENTHHIPNLRFSDKEYEQILNKLNTGNVFDRAEILRDKFALKRDNGDVIWITFLNHVDWCQNEFQVTNQISTEGKRKNRYDVTILINGLPLVQIELKRRGMDLKVAFDQIIRYKHESYDAGYGLFQYVQLFVISNGVNTKYFSNNKSIKEFTFKQTFFWSTKENKRISDLHDFSTEFLKPCHIAKMISRYMVLTVDKLLLVMRPYQYYAVEALIEKVKTSKSNAYIWHTTGSGKTLTSFKTSQIVAELPEVDKVVFVVDRKDLDYQTEREFNHFEEGSVDSAPNTSELVKKLNDPTSRIVLTTIQKLNNAITRDRHAIKMDGLKDKRVIFIFDECHRSQFGENHKNIKQYFSNCQMFGFTGTPILEKNASSHGGRRQTTADLFGTCLHKYLIVDAIRDENVLRFSVEYVGRYKKKESGSHLDIDVESIDTKELMEADDRLNKITDYIIDHHRQKTKHPDFTAMFCVDSVDSLIRYCDLFKQKIAETGSDLKIATIFSYQQNEANPEADGTGGVIPEDDGVTPEKVTYSRDKLDQYINDYNEMFSTKFSTKDSQDYYNYYKDIAKRVRQGQVDILLVVNMFLTGFDSPRLNTLYVDKNLKYHGLIQAFSRTNRILNDKKSQGNIICFRNLKEKTDEAIALFSNKDAKETVLLEPYENYVEKYNLAVEALLALTPTVSSVDDLQDENEQLLFVTRFRELLKLKNVITSFTDYKEGDLALTEQGFEDYKSKYLDIYERVKHENAKDKDSILNDVDFEIVLIHRDQINVAYIILLLTEWLKNGGKGKKGEGIKKQIDDYLSGEIQLRSKRALIEQFIEESLSGLSPDGVAEEFEVFWAKKKKAAFDALCQSEKIDGKKLQALLEGYEFTNQAPRSEELIEVLEQKPKILERKSTLVRVGDAIARFIDTFIEGMG
jgi:type I restriction enzyme R subunit